MEEKISLFNEKEGCNPYHVQAQIGLDGFMVEWRQYSSNASDYADGCYVTIVRDKNTLEEIVRDNYKSDIARYKGLKRIMSAAKSVVYDRECNIL